MAHQDVVPEGDPALWKYPPYSGVVAEGKLWGRGTTDCKCNMMSILEAVEELLETGFQPDYDIYLSFGYNEEVMGGERPAAQEAMEILRDRGVTPGAVIDECGGVHKGNSNGYEGMIASIIIAEKGYADYEVFVEHRGGHSSVPPKDSAMKLLAQAVIAIEEHPFPYRITESVKANMQASAPLMEGEVGKLMEDVEGNWDKLLPYIEADPRLSAMFHTTAAVTMASGSEQANILPQRCSVTVNCRPLEGDTLESIQKYFESIVPEGVQVRLLKGGNPPKASKIHTRAYDLIQSISEETYPGIVTIPGYMLGGTDSRYFSDISDSVYRFGSFLGTDEWGPAHAANECIPVDVLKGGPEFFVKFLTRY
jgi:carboxypeptidase PM20D1